MRYFPSRAMTKPTTPPGQTLAESAPDLAAEWHPSLNGDLHPALVTLGSKLQAHWLCTECAHTWQARIGSRVRGHGCPACARSRTGKARSLPATGESLAERSPELAAEWHPSLNGDLTPEQVRCKSNKKVWWLCPMCGHEWRTAVGNRATGAGCLPCSRKRRQRRSVAFPPQHPAVNASLSEQFPLIAAQWHPSRNGSRVPSEFRQATAAAVLPGRVHRDRARQEHPRPVARRPRVLPHRDHTRHLAVADRQPAGEQRQRVAECWVPGARRRPRRPDTAAVQPK